MPVGQLADDQPRRDGSLLGRVRRPDELVDDGHGRRGANRLDRHPERARQTVQQRRDALVGHEVTGDADGDGDRMPLSDEGGEELQLRRDESAGQVHDDGSDRRERGGAADNGLGGRAQGRPSGRPVPRRRRTSRARATVAAVIPPRWARASRPASSRSASSASVRSRARSVAGLAAAWASGRRCDVAQGGPQVAPAARRATRRHDPAPARRAASWGSDSNVTPTSPPVGEASARCRRRVRAGGR